MESNSNGIAKPNQVYENRKGTKNEGKDYEVSLLAYYGIFLLTDFSLQDAWIATNVVGCGDFDDIVIYWKKKEGGIEELFMIQSKHSTAEKTIKKENFITSKSSTKKDFYLEKYVWSYNTEIHQFSQSSNNLDINNTKQRLIDNLKCILFTNNKVEAKEILEGVQPQTLKYLNTGGNINKFKLGIQHNKTIFNATIKKIIAEDIVFKLISSLTLHEVLSVTNLQKTTSKIFMHEITDKEKLSEIILKVCIFKNILNPTNSVTKLGETVIEKLNKIFSTTVIYTIISDSKLNGVLKAKLGTATSTKELNNIFSTKKLDCAIPKEKLNELIAEKLRISDYFLDKKLFLFSNQMNNENVQEQVLKLLNKIIPKCNFDLNDIVGKYRSFINHWADGDLGGYYYLTKTHIAMKLTELLLERYTKKLFPQEEEPYNFRNIDKLDKIIEDEDISKKITVIDVDTNSSDNSIIFSFLYAYLIGKIKKYDIKSCYKQNWELPFSKDDQDTFYKINDILLQQEVLRVVGKNGQVTLYNILKALWKMGRLPLVLEVNIMADYEIIIDVLRLSEYKLKTIVLNQSGSVLTSHCPGIFTNLNDLSEESKAAVLEEVVELQGRPMQLKDLMEDREHLLKAVTAKDVIEILAKNGTFFIGKKLKDFPPYFVPRTIAKVLLDMTKFSKILEKIECFFVVKCHNKNQFSNHIKNLQISTVRIIDDSEIETEYRTALCEIIITNELSHSQSILETKFPDIDIHYLVFDAECNLEWIKSTGNVEPIQHCTLTTSNLSVDAKDALTHFSNKINVISAAPGMGKSTLLDYIAYTTPINQWVLSISLNDFKYEDFQRSLQNPQDQLRYFNDVILKQKPKALLDQEVFSCFLESDSLLVLLDGFDEICPSYKEQVTQMIKSFLSTKHRIWLTTRPAQKDYLENKFNTIALTLNSFTEQDQYNFLAKYFKDISKEMMITLFGLVRKKLNDVGLEFTSTPLHIMMLADVFEDNFTSNQSLDLTKKFDLLELYEGFLRKKIEILTEKHSDRAGIYQTYHKLHALQIVFPEIYLKKFQVSVKITTCSETIENIEEQAQHLGILVDASHSIFSHRTYAEYFAAEWLVSNPADAKDLIKELFQNSYDVVRNFFDRMLSRECRLHTLILNDQLDAAINLIETDPRVLNETDKGGRLAYHIAAAWGIRHPMPNLKELANPEIHHVAEDENKMVDVLERMCHHFLDFSKDTLLNFTPMDYAIHTHCLANLNTIMTNCKTSSSLNLWKHFTFYLYYCARYNYLNLFKAMMFSIEPAVETSTKKLKLCDINSPLTIHHCTALHVAVTYKQEKILKTLKDFGIDFNARDRYEHTALHYAVRKDSVNMMSFLISNGTDINAIDKQQRTALHHASKNCSLDTIRILLSSGSNIEAKDKDGRTPIHHATVSNCAEIVSLLIQAGANIEEKDNQGLSSLYHALKKDYREVVNLLLDFGADINSANKRCRTALHHAAKKGSKKKASLLLAYRADVEAKDDDGKTALLHAANNGNLKIVRLLISYKADITLTDNYQRTALDYARRRNHEDVQSFLLSNGAVLVQHSKKVDFHQAVDNDSISGVSSFLSNGTHVDTKDGNGRTALHIAAENGSYHMVEFLLSVGANVHEKNKSCRTPLHIAAQNDSSDIVSILLSAGARIEEKDKDKDSALRLAVKKGSFKAAEILLFKGADINTTNHRIRTALHHAAKDGLIENASWLLARRVNLEAKDDDGRTALHLAAKKQNLDMVKLLVSAGADVNSKDSLDRSSLHHARARGFSRVVSFLIFNGANKDTINIFGQNTTDYTNKYASKTKS